MNIKKVFGMMVISSMAAMLCACGSSKASASGNSKKLNIWTNMEVETDALADMGKKWGEKNGYEVNVIHQSPSVQQFAQAVKSKDAPDAVVGIPNDQLADYINSGLAMEVPANAYDDNDYSGAGVQACYMDGKRYAAPLAVETISLFYNTDLVSEVPDTWEELIETSKENGGIQFDATSIYYDLGFVRACGGYIFNYQNGAYDTSDIGLNNDGAVQAYTFINSLYKDYGYVSQDITADIARSNFQNGKTAYYIGGPWDIDGFKSAGTNFKVTSMPTYNGKPFATPVGTQVSFVSSKSDKQDAAWEFINYVMTDGAQELYKVGGRIPAKLSEQENEGITEDETTSAFITQINNGESLPTVSEMGQLWDIHTNNIRLMWSGELTPKEAADNIVTQLKEASQLIDSGKQG